MFFCYNQVNASWQHLLITLIFLVGGVESAIRYKSFLTQPILYTVCIGWFEVLGTELRFEELGLNPI